MVVKTRLPSQGLAIMNVWMAWCKRQATCKYCERLIEVTTPNVVCRSWKNGRKYEMHFHPDCWINNGLDYLRQHPYVITRQGRKRLPMDSEVATKRKELLKKHAMLVQQKKRVKARYPDNLIPLLRLDAKIGKLVEEIEDYGGAPPSWNCQL